MEGGPIGTDDALTSRMPSPAIAPAVQKSALQQRDVQDSATGHTDVLALRLEQGVSSENVRKIRDLIQRRAAAMNQLTEGLDEAMKYLQGSKSIIHNIGR